MNCLATASPIETTTASLGQDGLAPLHLRDRRAQAGDLALQEGQLRVELAAALVVAAGAASAAKQAHERYFLPGARQARHASRAYLSTVTWVSRTGCCPYCSSSIAFFSLSQEILVAPASLPSPFPSGPRRISQTMNS